MPLQRPARIAPRPWASTSIRRCRRRLSRRLSPLCQACTRRLRMLRPCSQSAFSHWLRHCHQQRTSTCRPKRARARRSTPPCADGADSSTPAGTATEADAVSDCRLGHRSPRRCRVLVAGDGRAMARRLFHGRYRNPASGRYRVDRSVGRRSVGSHGPGSDLRRGAGRAPHLRRGSCKDGCCGNLRREVECNRLGRECTSSWIRGR